MSDFPLTDIFRINIRHKVSRLGLGRLSELKKRLRKVGRPPLPSHPDHLAKLCLNKLGQALRVIIGPHFGFWLIT